MNILDLFSGIGGFSLGLERTSGNRTVAFVETEPFARRVLAKHWPDVPLFGDIRQVNAALFEMCGIPPIDIITGGFPCTDLSLAGRGAGLGTEDAPTARSGLWFEYLRLIDETRPEWVVIENVPPLRSRGLDVVLGGLAALGYDAWWDGISASAIGAPHQRDRIWIVAHAAGGGYTGFRDASNTESGPAERVPAARRIGASGPHGPGGYDAGRGGSGAEGSGFPHTHGDDGGPRGPGRPVAGCPGQSEPIGSLLRAEPVADSNGARLAFWQGFRSNLAEELAAVKRDRLCPGGFWYAEPDIRRVVDGPAARLVGPGKDAVVRAMWESQLKALGNHLVHGIPEAIGKAIFRSSVDPADVMNRITPGRSESGAVSRAPWIEGGTGAGLTESGDKGGQTSAPATDRAPYVS